MGDISLLFLHMMQITTGVKNCILPFKILLAGLILKLKENRLTEGKNQIYYACPYMQGFHNVMEPRTNQAVEFICNIELSQGEGNG